MAFRLWGKGTEETEASAKVAATGPLPQLPQTRHVPTAEEIRAHWDASRPGAPIPAVANLFGDATGQMLRGRLAEASGVDAFLSIVEEAQAYGDHEIARLAIDRARSLAVRRRELARIEELQAAMEPSELERALMAPEAHE